MKIHARNQLGTTGRRRVCWEGPKLFKLCPTHFFSGDERVPRSITAPLRLPKLRTYEHYT